MKPNLSGIDRMLRIALGTALLGMLAVVDGPARWYGLVGLMPLATGLIEWCPLYSLLGIRSSMIARPLRDAGACRAKHARRSRRSV
jgi:hypothetical protein